MFNHQPTKMTPTDNFSMPEANNLLSFVSSATVNIHEALGKPSKKRTVNIKKYALKRVKRLEQGSGRRGTISASMTKSKSAQLSPPSTKKQATTARAHASLMMIGCSNSWPELPLPPSQPSAAPQTSGVATMNYPTYVSHPPMQHSLSDPNLYPPTGGPGIDDDVDLDALLSDFNGMPDQQPVSSRHTSGSVTPCFTPQPNLETQVAIAEHPYSPYSDCGSDELYGDSAYSSPTNYSCSPVPPVATVPSAVSSANWTTSVHSPPMVMTQCSIACSSSWMEMPGSFHADPLTTGCSWVPGCSPLTTVNAPIPAVVDQGPPATPTVLQFLSEWGPYQ